MAPGTPQSGKMGPKPKKLSSAQRKRLIERFKREIESREREFPQIMEQEIKMLKMRFNDRLNKVVRTFWDVKLADVLKVERETSDKHKLTLAQVLTQLKHVKSNEL